MVRAVHPFLGRSDVRSIIEASPGNLVAVRADGLIGYVNPSALRLFGYGIDELVGLPVETLVPEALVHEHVRQRVGYVADPVPRSMGTGRELAARRKDGVEFAVEVSLTPLQTPDGPWILAHVVDISLRRAAAAQLLAANRSYRMLAHTNQAIVRAASVDELYRDTCRVVAQEGDYSGAWVAKPQPSGELDMVAVAGHLEDYISQLRVTIYAGDARGRGPVSVALRENRPVYVKSVGSERDACPGVGASASLPLRIRGGAVAVLTIYSEREDAFDYETRDLLEGMAENASFGLAGFAAADALDLTAVKSAELVRRLVRAQEDERSRIAADVHDESVQSLAVVDLRLGLLLRQVEAQAPELAEAVHQLQETVGIVASGLRLLLFELESTDAAASLPDMLSEAASVIFEGHDIRWSIEVDAPPELAELSLGWLPEPNRTQVVRVAKEALVNVRKHSGARTVSVVLTPAQDGVEVAVVDDGVGIDPGRARSAPGHRGLTTMRERVEIGGGWTQLEGGPAGTTLRFWMPRVADGDLQAR